MEQVSRRRLIRGGWEILLLTCISPLLLPSPKMFADMADGAAYTMIMLIDPIDGKLVFDWFPMGTSEEEATARLEALYEKTYA